MVSFAEARRNMVDCQLRTFDVHDRALLAAMAEVPREAFVAPGLRDLAYRDGNLPLSGDESGPDSRVLLAPMVLARLIQALGIEAGMRVLDVAGGPGYSAAILARLGARVTALESRSDAWAGTGAPDGIDGPEATRRTGDLAAGCPEDGPFDAILVNGALATEPIALLGQLTDGGRLACIRAEDGRPARATLYVRSGDSVGSRALFDAAAPILAAFRPAPAFVF